MAAAEPLLSRVADAVYWMSRYVERAENVARFIDVNFQLMLDLPQGFANQWQPLVETSGDRRSFAVRHDGATKENVIQFLAFDAENPNSIISCVRAARENARSVRETISSEMWEQVNSLYLLLKSNDCGQTTESLPEFLRKVRMECHLFQGVTDVTMSHNEAWNFIRLGRKLERADKTTRILDVKYFILLPSVQDVGTPYDDIQWSALLKSVSGFEMYRKRHGGITPAEIVKFLMLDNEFPRAVRYCIDCADASLHAITGSPAGSFSCRTEQQMGLLRSELAFARLETILASGLHEFVDGLQTRMNRIDACLAEEFVAQEQLSAGVGASA